MLQVEALVIRKVEFDFILSRPDMKRLRLNIAWNDEVTTYLGAAVGYCATQQVSRVATNADCVPKLFPELLRIEAYPPAATFIKVPFKLRDCTVVRKKPYSMSHEKKMWLKAKLQGMLDAGIIRPSTSSFFSDNHSNEGGRNPSPMQRLPIDQSAK